MALSGSRLELVPQTFLQKLKSRLNPSSWYRTNWAIRVQSNLKLHFYHYQVSVNRAPETYLHLLSHSLLNAYDDYRTISKARTNCCLCQQHPLHAWQAVYTPPTHHRGVFSCAAWIRSTAAPRSSLCEVLKEAVVLPAPREVWLTLKGAAPSGERRRTTHRRIFFSTI